MEESVVAGDIDPVPSKSMNRIKDRRIHDAEICWQRSKRRQWRFDLRASLSNIERPIPVPSIKGSLLVGYRR